MNSLIRVALAVTAMTALSIEAPQAKPRPTVDEANGDTCWTDPTTDKDIPTDGGRIMSCCYDDGCWICGVDVGPADDCVWEQKAMVGGRGLPELNQNLTISPGLVVPPKARPLEGVRVRPQFSL